MVSLTVILLGTKCYLFVYTYTDLLTLKVYKLFQNGDADLSWLLFSKKPTCNKLSLFFDVNISHFVQFLIVELQYRKQIFYLKWTSGQYALHNQTTNAASSESLSTV